MKLFIVLACILAITAAEQKGKKAKGENNSKNSICSKKLSVRPDDCCPGMPSLKKYFAGCAAQCNVTLPAGNATAEQGSSGKYGKGEGRGKGEGPGKDAKKQMFKCVMPCVLKAANALGADGNISSTALNAALLAGVSADWAQVVSAVTSACIVNATAMMNSNKTKDKSSEEKDSNSTRHGPCFNGMVMKCVFKNLYLSCPSKILSTNSSCTDLTSKMSQCELDGEGKHGEKGKDSGENEGKGGKGGKGEKNGKQSQKENKNEKNGKHENKNNKSKGKPTTQVPTTSGQPTAQAIGK
ncbi:uncharacterized protein [Chironomus tepperi]|uniref:uncharacterized protein n=1 Tax=Chironomus tepperi TaxID=113505 RepID=UPI00391FB12D